MAIAATFMQHPILNKLIVPLQKQALLQPSTYIHASFVLTLQYLLGGLSEIDLVDWRNNTEYGGGYTGHEDVVQWFWKAVENYDGEMRARLLQFVTGTSKVPMNGFSELQGWIVDPCVILWL